MYNVPGEFRLFTADKNLISWTTRCTDHDNMVHVDIYLLSLSLTGMTEPELPEARRGHEGAQGVDAHPWIWKAARKQGYVTQWGEDGAAFGTFTYRMLGFTYQPVDHYMRPFYIQVGFTYRKRREGAHHAP